MPPRVVEQELMDGPDLPAASHQQALRGLARLNRLSGSTRLVARSLKPLLRNSDRPLRVLDLATGGGDVPIALHRRFVKTGKLVIAGCDRSPTAVEHARASAAQAGADVDFFRLDALHDPLPEGFDVLTCSLFLHHLSENDAASLLQKMGEATRRAVIVNDLCRGRFNLFAVWVATRAVTRSPIVHADGPASVRAAFTVRDLERLARSAGLHGAHVRSHFPCRMVMTWCKP